MSSVDSAPFDDEPIASALMTGSPSTSSPGISRTPRAIDVVAAIAFVASSRYPSSPR
jgi:hypothetical protein